MTSGDLCVAAPARPVTCEEKVYPGVVWRRAQPRCLFGPPDPVETEKLLQEQTRIELERFQRRWDVDLELLEAAIQERLQPSPSQDKPVANPGSTLRPTVDRPKRLQPGGLKRQTYLTEFWRSRRSLTLVFGKSKNKMRASVSLQTPSLE
ncbi:uncharacterized protein LOC124357967 [Homalodisca vitripennis]|uniref:uncharacterized protein LOC124357967 n=1 Tax=Homalodisca vitripennis TaxID=197043 RepID=UPI001EEB6BB1|nr:uncharacterized protein LOC124357967 [Homalodisca vitripennis]